MYGSHPYHHWGVEGTIPLRFETHIALLEDIVRGASVAGFNKFIILSAHGQVSSTIVAVHKLGIEGNFVECAYCLNECATYCRIRPHAQWRTITCCSPLADVSAQQP